jgi:GNAT superfamily N-acetyltransferase
MIYREATPEDVEQVALLHAQSWQRHYRGILQEDYLKNQVLTDRRQVWRERLQHPAENQYVLLVEEDHMLCGLACLYFNHDPVWGSLLDNLHVSSVYQGQGIGRQLLASVAARAYAYNHSLPLYLWVYAKNESARGFYASLGGSHEETQRVENPGGGYGEVYRYVWKDVTILFDRK